MTVRVFFWASLLIFSAFTIFPAISRAVSYAPGVKVGDWIKYGQLNITWTGNGTEPSYITEEKKADWIKMEVVSVVGATVNINITTHYPNGTQTFYSGDVDLSGTMFTLSRYLFPANLKKGDPVSTQPYSPTINQTTSGTYASATRNVNLLNITQYYLGQNMTVTVYFDQITGFMVEMYMKTPDRSIPGAYTELSVKATETNMWSPDLLGLLNNNLIYIIAGTAVIIVIIAAAFALRKKPSVPPPPSETPRPSQN